MRLDRFKQGPLDRKRYVCDYADWMNETENLVGVTMTGNNVDDQFIVNAFTLDPGLKQVIYYIAGGISGKTYRVDISITTSMAQIKADYFEFDIK